MTKVAVQPSEPLLVTGPGVCLTKRSAPAEYGGGSAHDPTRQRAEHVARRNRDYQRNRLRPDQPHTAPSLGCEGLEIWPLAAPAVLSLSGPQAIRTMLPGFVLALVSLSPLPRSSQRQYLAVQLRHDAAAGGDFRAS